MAPTPLVRDANMVPDEGLGWKLCERGLTGWPTLRGICHTVRLAPGSTSAVPDAQVPRSPLFGCREEVAHRSGDSSGALKESERQGALCQTESRTRCRWGEGRKRATLILLLPSPSPAMRDICTHNDRQRGMLMRTLADGPFESLTMGCLMLVRP
jgi:hypothetical protein